MGSRLGIPNRKPAGWARALDRLHQLEPPCMSRPQWTLYLSGVAAMCVADRMDAQRLCRTGRVNPCAECAAGFRLAAAEAGRCQPDFFLEPRP